MMLRITVILVFMTSLQGCGMLARPVTSFFSGITGPNLPMTQTDGNLPLVELNFDEFTRELSRLTSSKMLEQNVPGVSIALIHEGKIAWSQSFGLADIENQIPVETDTVFQVASLSKTVTAVAILKLAEEGKIDLNDPVEKHLTRWKMVNSRYDHNLVTIGRVLNHTAGLNLHGHLGFEPHEKLPTLEESLDGNHGETLGQRLFTSSRPFSKFNVKVIQQPGKKYRYSGGGYTILQLLIEEVTGQSFSDYMDQQILSPLGMNSSGFEWNAAILANTAKAYEGLFAKTASPNYIYTAKAAGGLYSTSEDYARFLISLLIGAENTLLKDSTKKLMIDARYGYEPEEVLTGTSLIQHRGSSRGRWNSKFIFDPEGKEGIVIFTNSDGGIGVTTRLGELWASWVFAKGYLFKNATLPQISKQSNRVPGLPRVY